MEKRRIMKIEFKTKTKEIPTTVQNPLANENIKQKLAEVKKMKAQQKQDAQKKSADIDSSSTPQGNNTEESPLLNKIPTAEASWEHIKKTPPEVLRQELEGELNYSKKDIEKLLKFRGKTLDKEAIQTFPLQNTPGGKEIRAKLEMPVSHHNPLMDLDTTNILPKNNTPVRLKSSSAEQLRSEKHAVIRPYDEENATSLLLKL